MYINLCILELGSGQRQRLLYRLGSGLVLLLVLVLRCNAIAHTVYCSASVYYFSINDDHCVPRTFAIADLNYLGRADDRLVYSPVIVKTPKTISRIP